jgi:hypothetical protein
MTPDWKCDIGKKPPNSFGMGGISALKTKLLAPTLTNS